MAKIVLGLGVSHGPMLSIPAQYWEDRAKADRANPKHFFRGKTYTFAELAELRAAGNYAVQSTLEICQARAAKCQAAISKLADILDDAHADVAVIVGNDQMEIFTADHVPAFAIVWGPYVEGIPRDQAFLAKLPPGVARAELDRTPSVYTQYPCHPELGEYLIRASMNDGFDPAQITKLTTGEIGSNAAPHAYGFVYRRIMRDKVVPNVPLVANTFYPPNQPTAKRLYDFGQLVGETIDSWDKDLRVAVIGSGGMTHFCIDEEFDNMFFDAFKNKDAKTLTDIDDGWFQSGTSETKNWITVAGILSETDLRMNLIDYVPSCRSEAGTGCGMGFAVWQ